MVSAGVDEAREREDTVQALILQRADASPEWVLFVVNDGIKWAFHATGGKPEPMEHEEIEVVEIADDKEALHE